MDQFIAHLLIKQIEKDNKIAQSQKNTVKKELVKNNSCNLCGQNSYWCQCDNSNDSPKLSTPPLDFQKCHNLIRDQEYQLKNPSKELHLVMDIALLTSLDIAWIRINCPHIINQEEPVKKNSCNLCGQNSYWCQCPIITNIITNNIIDNSNDSPQLFTPPS